MTDNSNQPRQDDLILGGQAPPTGAVLGGLDSIKQRFSSGVWDQQVAAATQALQYGEVGFNLLLQVLKQPESSQLRWAVYEVLSRKTEPEIEAAVFQYSPYRSFQHLLTLFPSDVGRSHLFAISPDSKQLVTYSSEAALKVWNLETGDLLRSFPLSETTKCHYAIAISPDGEYCFIAYLSNHIQIRNLRTGETIEELECNVSNIKSLVVSPDHQTLIIAAIGGLEALDLRTKKLYPLERGYTDKPQFSLDGELLLYETAEHVESWTPQRFIRVRNLESGELHSKLLWHVWRPWSAAQISPDKRTIVGVDTTSLVQQWNLATGAQLHKLQLNTVHKSHPFSAAFSPDGQTLLEVYTQGEVKLWNWQTGKLLCLIQGHPIQAKCDYQSLFATFTPNGQFAVASGRNSTIHIWGTSPEDKTNFTFIL